MPVNAGPEFFAAMEEYRRARDLREKIRALERALSLAPDHKGAEKLRMQIKRRIAELKRKLERERKKKKGSGWGFFIKREGDAQLVLLGPANSGKTFLMEKLTNARVEASPNPFSTNKPVPGMLEFEGVKIQLIDTPSIYLGARETKGKVYGLARNSDGIVLVINALNASQELREMEEELKATGLWEKVRLVVLTHCDLSDPDVSCGKRTVRFPCDPNVLKREIFGALGLIRVYTKKPGEKPDFSRPLVLKKGATVLDAAKQISKELARNLRRARVWGSTKFPGQYVAPDYVLQDGDVLEIRIEK